MMTSPMLFLKQITINIENSSIYHQIR